MWCDRIFCYFFLSLAVLFLAVAYAYRNETSRVVGQDAMISHSREDVWKVISKLEDYSLWSTFYKRFEDSSGYSVGSVVYAIIDLDGTEEAPLRLVIREIDPPNKICRSSVPFGESSLAAFFLSSYRCIELSTFGPRSDGKTGTVVKSYEDLGGILGVIFVRLLGPSLVKRFNSVHTDLKEFMMGTSLLGPCL